MYFQIRKLILWPKKGDGKRIVEFQPGMVNVITGASKTGKSAVIPIIDYCLCSGRCAVPVGVIREACSWFGVLVETVEGKKLLARREPGEQRQTGDMYLAEGDEVEIPERIEQRNANASQVKVMLDRLAGLSHLGFDPDSEGAYRTRPSFRDLVAFSFQPQNIVANPDVLFFKADTTEHREKLRTIFPYVLNAVTADVLAARWEIAQQQRTLRRLEQELRAATSMAEVWRIEAQGWLRQAIEYGLHPADARLPSDWVELLDVLRIITESTSRSASPTLESLETSLVRLEELRSEEADAAAVLSENRQRYNELRRLLQSSVVYGSAIRVQRDRLQLSEWIRGRVRESSDTVVQLTMQGQQDVADLCAALEGIEMRVRSQPTMSDTLDKERIRLAGQVERSIERITRIRREIELLERESDEARDAVYRSDRIDRFLGRLEQAIKLYDQTDENASLKQNIEDKKMQIEDLRARVSEREVQRRLTNALRSIEAHAATIIPKLDAEWPDAPIRLLVDDLSLQVIQGTREDYLWEIGSAANWLSYHIAVTLALQYYFLSQPHHPVPGVLVYDQPSQAYFPRRGIGLREGEELDWKDEDVIAVRKAIKAVAEEVGNGKGRLQVVLLDHADEDVWGAIEDVHLVENWREGRKLVPENWL